MMLFTREARCLEDMKGAADWGMPRETTTGQEVRWDGWICGLDRQKLEPKAVPENLLDINLFQTTLVLPLTKCSRES